MKSEELRERAVAAVEHADRMAEQMRDARVGRSDTGYEQATRAFDKAKEAEARSCIAYVRSLPALGEAVAGKPFAYATHHADPMLTLSYDEAASHCGDNEKPINLYATTPPQVAKHGLGRYPLTGTTYEGRALVCEAKTLTVGGEFKVMPD
mgnify:CR=1 FL=1